MMRRRVSSAVRRRRPRAGFSLIEVIVAFSLLAIIMSSLARLTTLVTQRSRGNDIVSKRTFALQHEANRLGALTFAQLATESTGSTLMLLGDFQFTRTLTITAVGTTRYTIKVVVSPSDYPSRTDSLVFDRTKPATGTVLCTSC
jgi:prepilin-type N-terminal cleavage/methylation domain-containing protein